MKMPNAAKAANAGDRPDDRRYLDQDAVTAWLNETGFSISKRQVKRLFSAADFPRLKMGRKTYVRADRLAAYIDGLDAG